MKFGQVADPSQIDFTLPKDHPKTQEILEKSKGKDFNIYIGCAKWNKTDLKGFYPKGTKDELKYYATQFNSIELNATFYSLPSPEQVLTWKEKTPPTFKFFPKITNNTNTIPVPMVIIVLRLFVITIFILQSLIVKIPCQTQFQD